MTVDPVKDSVRAVDRALAVLQAFTPAEPRLSVLELQARTGLSRPTLYRLITALEGRGLVRAEGEPRRFTLGPAVMGLAQVWLAALDVRRLAETHLAALRDATGETAGLFLLREGKRLCVAEAPSRHVLGMTRGLGETEPITRGASGRAMLAFAPAETPWVQQALAGQDLSAELAHIRRRGHAISRAEVFQGAVAIAAPVFDHAGAVVGALALYGPEARLARPRQAEAAQLVMAAARALSGELGHR